jgi:UDP-N-acetylglucosamine 2-epimerase (non-hydrolysing)|tara:strand:- start:519 stop:1637 length:1119 start_codon:yes stop_codon:yes gene_type:complete
MKICIVLSTRPEIIKLASLIEILKKKKINFFLINTNQHYTQIMSKVFFNFFKIPAPKYNIKASSSKSSSFFSKTIGGIEKLLYKEKPNFLIVQGDTNTALAGCFAASIFNRKYFIHHKKIKIVHIEAGLRSFDDKMPEEINRKIIDQLSNILFVPTKFDLDNLKNEKLISNKKVFTVGNTISDIIEKNAPLIKKNNILSKFKILKKSYFLVTLHRPESVDDPIKLKKLVLDLEKVGQIFETTFLFPVHPRTDKIIKKLNINKIKFIKFTKPLEFLDFLTIMKSSKIIFTDSGGIQEEASLLGVPCITIRDTTERQLSIKSKNNILTGYDYNKILKAVMYFNKNKVKPSKIFGDGKVADRIFNILKKIKNNSL